MFPQPILFVLSDKHGVNVIVSAHEIYRSNALPDNVVADLGDVLYTLERLHTCGESA